MKVSQDGVVDIVTRLRTVLAGERKFSHLQSIDTGCGPHPAFHSVDTRCSFAGDNVACAWNWPLACILCRTKYSADTPLSVDRFMLGSFLKYNTVLSISRDSSVSIATRYGLDGPGIESRLGRDFPHLFRLAVRPTQPPIQWVLCLSWG